MRLLDLLTKSTVAVAAAAAVADTTMTMRAVLQNGFGKPTEVLRVGDAPRPVLKKGDEVLVRVVSASVNTPDWASTMGVPYLLRLAFSSKNRVVGTDLAGVVEEVLDGGEAHKQGFRVGDEVLGSTEGSTGGGSIAEYALAKHTMLAKKPESISFDEAAGVPMSGVTAWQVLRDGAKVRPGLKLLINGASGGIGTFAVQMAKAKGAEVTAVCSGRNEELVKSLGADHFIDYTKEDFTKREEKFDVVMDNVMNRPFKETSKALTKGGFVIPNGMGVERSKWFGAIPSFIFKPRNYPAIECKSTSDNLIEVTDMIASGKVKVVVDRIFPMEDAAKAVEYMASHRARGQVIIRVSNDTDT